MTFTDYVYRNDGGGITAERAFALFLAALEPLVDELSIVGRLTEQDRPMHYRLPSSIRFVPLPYYESLTRPLAVLRSLCLSLGRFWRELDTADHVWLLGPYPHAIAFALITRIRRRHLVLGVRQDLPTLIRSRRPRSRWTHLAADVLELTWRMLARGAPVVVVGPDLKRQYRRSPAVLELAVSLISSRDVDAGEAAAVRSYEGELRLLSVGRLDHEKNPLLLADVLAGLRERDPRWRLTVCGEGPMRDALERRLQALELSSHAELTGYVPLHGGLLDLYRSSHAFLHVSLTEGMPQVLIEAFASGVPVVATAVGGVEGTAGDAAVLIPPQDAAAAVSALEKVVNDPDLRQEIVGNGLELARRHTQEAEVRRVADFISSTGANHEAGAPPGSLSP